MNKLELLSLGNYFLVEKSKEENVYTIQSKAFNLGATINNKNKKISYYVTDCYDSGIDWLEIDEKEFENLKKFCELMIKGDNNE